MPQNKVDHEGLSWISISTNLLSKKHGNLEQVENSQNCKAFSIALRISGKLELFANKHRGWISNEKTPIKENSRTSCFTGGVHEIFKEQLISLFLKLLQINEHTQ